MAWTPHIDSDSQTSTEATEKALSLSLDLLLELRNTHCELLKEIQLLNARIEHMADSRITFKDIGRT